MIKNKKYLILVIIWMVGIFYFSNQPAEVSSSQSGSLIKMLSNIPIIGSVITYMMEVDIAQFIIRKGAHMFAYFLLGILWFMSMYDNKANLKQVCISAFVFTVLYACTDEIHQLFIPGRSGEIRDVLVDSCGALIGLIPIYLMKKKTS